MKKVLVFDEAFHVLEEYTRQFAEVPDDEGFPSEDLTALSQWVQDHVQRYLTHPAFIVTHINFTAYGASLVHLNSDNQVVAPFYNYLKPLPENTRAKFLNAYNANQDICLSTASPWLGLLNSGLQLYWLKHEKQAHFNQIITSLHLPQYLPFLITGQKFCEITSVGCHTMLWNFNTGSYHQWVAQEKIQSLFPPIYHSDHRFTFEYQGRKLWSGVGVHDSSAALMPYLVAMKEPFLLLSTGTWNITFNPFSNSSLTHNELERDCLCYLTYQNKPVKASRIFLGHEHEAQLGALAEHFNVQPDYFKSIAFDHALYQQLCNEADDKKDFYPLDMHGTGPIPNPPTKKTDLHRFSNPHEAYHQLVRFMARWQKLSIDLADPYRHVKNLIVVGGFTKSLIFLETLKREIPERLIMISDHPRAAALGAAWLVQGKDGYSEYSNLLNISKF